MISSISWVPKGAAKNVPVVAEPPTQEEIDEAIKAIAGRDGGSDADADADEDDDAGAMNVDGAEDEVEAEEEEGEVDEVAQAKAAAKALAKGSGGVDDVVDGLRELNMDAYDDEEDGLEIFSTGMGDLYYPSNDMDPYINKNDDDEDEDDEEIEDNIIKPTDFVIVCAHSEDDVYSLQVNIIEELEDGERNMFVHHDVPLPDFPLCTVWMDFNLKGGDRGNFLAVGTMGPAIEIWDLDMVDELQPHMVLGGLSKKKKKEKGKKGKKYKKGSHRSSVLGLAWNKEVRNVLASASADKTVKIWDLAVGKCAVTLEHHDDKVSLENGIVQSFDKRAASSNSSGLSAFTLHAHEKAVSTISFCPSAPNLLATGSTDKMVKLWDLSNNQPSCVASLNPKIGAIFSVSFSNDNPFLLACGGSKGELTLWNTIVEPVVASKFGR